jgi:putative modified peptide
MAFQLPESIVDTLLDKLGNDDAFRSRFTADPRSALASLGFAPAADASIQSGIWTCVTVNQLASKEVIRAGYSTLRAQLCAQSASYNPIGLGLRNFVETRAA